MMRAWVVAIAMVTAPVAVPGQTKSPAKAATKSAAKVASKSVPRASNGKPDLTGVWQGGSNRRGTWEEANTGLGVGGTGTDPTAPVAPSSNDRPAGSSGAPYQPWAAKKVLESYNMRAIDDPTSRCLPSGIPRIVMLGLFPQQIIQTPQQIVILYEYMNVFRVIPLNAKHPDDLIPLVRDADIVAVIGTKVPTRVVEAMTQCRAIARMGAGTDKIDVARATDLGIVVANTPYFCVEEQADHAMAMLLSLARKLTIAQNAMAEGDVMRARRAVGNNQRISTCTLGLVGFGRSAVHLARP